MRFVYNLFIFLYSFGLKLFSYWNEKARLKVIGTRDWQNKIKAKVNKGDKVVWMHASSLGEFEQGRPLLDKIKKQYPKVKILVSFFSASGYEVMKNYKNADLVFYLPSDTEKNAQELVNLIDPKLVVFVKYEYWFNLMNVLSKRDKPFIYISAIFRHTQYFFKTYGSWFANHLKLANHFFLQDTKSKELLTRIGLSNLTISGDTRFDRVKELASQNQKLEFVEQFKNEKLLFIAGSTWRFDDKLMAKLINKNQDIKFLIAPHNIENKAIDRFLNSINQKSIRYTSWLESKESLVDYNVFVLDTIGLLTKAYASANVVYVGGGFDTSGIHNILEPAAYGVPVLFGPRKNQFIEAVEIDNIGAGICVENEIEFLKSANLLIQNQEIRNIKGKLAKEYVEKNIYSVECVFKFVIGVLQ